MISVIVQPLKSLLALKERFWTSQNDKVKARITFVVLSFQLVWNPSSKGLNYY